MKFGYLAFKGFEKELLGEIQHHKIKEVIQKDRLFLLEEDLDLIWAQLKLTSLEIFPIDSINNAAKKLKSEKKLWASYSFHLHRRTQLIQENVFKIKPKTFAFPHKIPSQEFGFWCLLSEKEVLKARTHNPLPLGEIHFEEDKKTPPSRAYLKLWEAFMLYASPPEKKTRVLDMGSCPGGWTWVLQTLGCHVISVDKAPLEPHIQRLPHIEFIKKDAFKLNPHDVLQPDWFFSDIICEPPRLLQMVHAWREAYPKLKFICTIKYRGATDFKTTDEFLKVPGSFIKHLNHNKHEVTWFKL